MSKYVALLARTGARPLALACGLGWLSFASYGFAIVLAVADATGSFAVAGGAVGAFSAGSALLAPFRGRYVDRHGPRALARFAPVHAVALGLLVVGCLTTDSSWLLVGTAGIAGLFTPPLIATARAVWPDVAGSELVTTAHALNAALGDAGLVVGPALTGVVASSAIWPADSGSERSTSRLRSLRPRRGQLRGPPCPLRCSRLGASSRPWWRVLERLRGPRRHATSQAR